MYDDGSIGISNGFCPSYHTSDVIFILSKLNLTLPTPIVYKSYILVAFSDSLIIITSSIIPYIPQNGAVPLSTEQLFEAPIEAHTLDESITSDDDVLLPVVTPSMYNW